MKLDLDAILAESVGEVTLFGRTYQIKAMDGADWKAYLAVTQGDQSDPTPMYPIAGRQFVPALTNDEALKLSPKVLGQVLGLSMMGIQMVERELPNSSAPTTETPLSASTSGPSESGSISDTSKAG